MKMGSLDGVDDMTFRVNFTADGVAKLRERVNEKLKEFMGDYTDDTLVEYVIVLLRNGRRKEEAKNELNVFLGDDSDSFVSWLWDHMASNLDNYVQSQESSRDEVSKVKSAAGDFGRRNDSHLMDSESEREKPTSKSSRIRHNREWKGLMRDAYEVPPLRSSVVESIHGRERSHGRSSHAKRSLSPKLLVQRKRNRVDEQHHSKEAVCQATINAPRRLLQFAVRDAVATSRPTKPNSEPASKRLRSVVSTSTEDSAAICSQRIQSVARVASMATVVKAVAEAAKDVVKVKSSGSVFDRLGRGTDGLKSSDQLAEFREAAGEDGDYENINQITMETKSTFGQSEYDGEYSGSLNLMETEAELDFENEEYDDDDDDADEDNIMNNRVRDVSQTGTSGLDNGYDSPMGHYGEARNEAVQNTHSKNQHQHMIAVKTSTTVNMSANVNTRKPQQFQAPKGAMQIDSRRPVLGNDAGNTNSKDWQMRENSNTVMLGNGNAQATTGPKKESQRTLMSAPGLYSVARPSEDADSRTIFVSNVHFAATKDDLSRHFNKFGEVLKVVIVTDAATGQPKGAAYVEFMRKEAADNALSLDGTSFMSRILKVVKRSSAHQEIGSLMAWPRIARGSPFAVARFRYPFPRGIPTPFRSRLPVKPGARSYQWKRDAQSTSSVAGSNHVPSLPRSLTYVRTEPKPDGNTGAAST